METKKPLEKSSVRKLQESLDVLIALQAKNLSEIAEGRVPEIPVEPKVWADVLKMMELMPKFKTFEAIPLEPVLPDDEITDAVSDEMPEATPTMSVISGNAFESVSKRVKERLNGKTDINRKKN